MWKSHLQDYMFARLQNINMSDLDLSDTLAADYFKKHKDFKDKHKAHSADSEKKEQDPSDNVDYASGCFAHAIKTGRGFKEWLPGLSTFVRSSLSTKIHSQTSGVRTGDLLGLLEAIKLSVHQHEIYKKI